MLANVIVCCLAAVNLTLLLLACLLAPPTTHATHPQPSYPQPSTTHPTSQLATSQPHYLNNNKYSARSQYSRFQTPIPDPLTQSGTYFPQLAAFPLSLVHRRRVSSDADADANDDDDDDDDAAAACLPILQPSNGLEPSNGFLQL